jgi:hypothetical protein
MMQKKYAHDSRAQGLLVNRGEERMCQCLAMTKRSDGSLRYAFDTVRSLKEANIDILR